jgi:DNA-binding LacI/PurR family transcriptional regulator
MSTTINQRITTFIRHVDLTPNAFAKSIGLENSGTIYNITKETQQDISSRILSMIAEAYPDLNMHWVITGKGSMLLHNQPVTSRKTRSLEERVTRLENELKKIIVHY